MAFLIIPLVALLTGLSVYRLLPALIGRPGGFETLASLLQDRPNRPNGRQFKLPGKWTRRFDARLRQAGLGIKNRRALLCCIFIAPALALMIGTNLIQQLMLVVLMGCLVNSWISSRIRSRRKAFTKSLYKIYRFLDLQLESGVKATDAFRGLPEAVQDQNVRPILIRFAARYELTLNLSDSLDEIRLAFPGTDTDLLATHLRQCLQTGQAGRSLLRMEELLFARCFSLMQSDTVKIRSQLLLTGLLGVSPFLILFLYPLAMQTLSALQTVFG